MEGVNPFNESIAMCNGMVVGCNESYKSKQLKRNKRNRKERYSLRAPPHLRKSLP